MKLTLSLDGTSYINYSASDLIEQYGLARVEAAVKEQRAINNAHSRKQAYQQHSDPLFIELQYDQTTATTDAQQAQLAKKQQQWQDKVAAIKQQYPLDPSVIKIDLTQA